MVDFHSHILPVMDDGSSSVEMSLAMLQAEAAHGVRQVITTPHFYAREESPAQFLSRRAEAERQLREALFSRDDLPQVLPGAEVAWFRGMSDSEELRSLRIGNTAFLLVELPLPPWNEQVYQELEGIANKQGLTPIVAHVERYILPLQNRKLLDRLLQLPILIQTNARFFAEAKTQKRALSMLREEKIHLLGSDCHNLKTRPPNLDAAVAVIAQKLGQPALQHIDKFEQMVLQSCL